MKLYFNHDRAFIMIEHPDLLKKRMCEVTDELNNLLPKDLQLVSCELIKVYDPAQQAYRYNWLMQTDENDDISSGKLNQARDIILLALKSFHFTDVCFNL